MKPPSSSRIRMKEAGSQRSSLTVWYWKSWQPSPPRSEVRPRPCFSQACRGDVQKGRAAQQHLASSGRSRLGVVRGFNADHIYGHPAKCSCWSMLPQHGTPGHWGRQGREWRECRELQLERSLERWRARRMRWSSERRGWRHWVREQRWRSLDPGDVRRHLVERGVPQSTRKEGWRTVCEGLRRNNSDLQALEYEDGEEDDRTRPPPWREALPFDFHYTQTVKTEPQDIQRQRAEACLEEWDLPTSSFSWMERRKEAPREVGGCGGFGGGGGQEALPPGRKVLQLLHCWGGRAAGGVRWLGEREGWTTAALIMDSMSLLQALQGRGGMQSGRHPKRAVGPLWQQQAG